METFWVRALQLMASLSLLIIVHEFGHFIFARLFKIRVEKFYLFFDPWFELLKFKPKGSETEYGIGWLPLGGYVKIAGMIDESLDKEAMSQPPQEWEFRSKPAWQRLIVMLAGVTFNFLLALVIYSGVLYVWGEKYLPLHNATMGMEYCESAKEVGFEDGDILWAVDGKELECLDGNSIQKIMGAKEVEVKRQGSFLTIPIPADFSQRILKEKEVFASLRYPMIVKEVQSVGAKEAGLLSGDSVVSVNNGATISASEVSRALNLNKGKVVEIGFFRAGQFKSTSVPLDEEGKMGIVLLSPYSMFEMKEVHYTLLSSIPAGVKRGVDMLSGYASSMKHVFTKEGAKSLGGFGSIGSLFPPKWDWYTFWEMSAFLSIILAFMNVLPIPALDGGHVFFLLFEVVTRKKPSDNFMEKVQVAGMCLLLLLLLYANGNDVFRFFFK